MITVSPSDTDAAAQALLQDQDHARLDAACQTIAQVLEAEDAARDRDTHVQQLKDRLAAMDPAPVEKLCDKAAATLEAYFAVMGAFNAPLLTLQAELVALARDLPADVEPRSYSNG